MIQSQLKIQYFQSAILEKEMAYGIYFPPNYSVLKRYPVLYFLHGRSGDETLLLQLELQNTIDKLVYEGKIEPLIIITPRMDNSRGINSSTCYHEVKDMHNRIIHVGRYEDYFINELIPQVQDDLKTHLSKEGRFIGGASAGGYAALHYALRHSELFSKVGGHMPALELQLDEEDKPYFPDHALWKKYNPFYIVDELDTPLNLQCYLDAGDEDEGQFYEGCAKLSALLEEKKISVVNSIFPGHHSLSYIQGNFEKYLQFYVGK